MAKCLSVELKKHSGVALILVIFILLVLAVAGSLMLKFHTNQLDNSLMAIYSNQAKNLAKFGINLAQNELKQNPSQCVNQEIYFDEKFKSLKGFRLIISCKKENNILQIYSQASYGEFGRPLYVSYYLRKQV